MLLVELLVFVLAASTNIESSVGPYCYLGIRFGTSAEELRDTFPLSSDGSNHFRVVRAESRGYVGTVSVSDYRLSIGFERKNDNGESVYPTCRSVFNRIFEEYGGPNVVQRFQVEMTPAHNRTWKRGRGRMKLLCFERDGTRFAERVDLYDE